MPRPRNDGLNPASSMVEKVTKNMTAMQIRRWRQLDAQTTRMWRDFWVHVLKEHGYTNAEIAQEFGISESTVRYVMKGN